jgi:hypothetical protein
VAGFAAAGGLTAAPFAVPFAAAGGGFTAGGGAEKTADAVNETKKSAMKNFILAEILFSCYRLKRSNL